MSKPLTNIYVSCVLHDKYFKDIEYLAMRLGNLYRVIILYDQKGFQGYDSALLDFMHIPSYRDLKKLLTEKDIFLCYGGGLSLYSLFFLKKVKRKIFLSDGADSLFFNFSYPIHELNRFSINSICRYFRYYGFIKFFVIVFYYYILGRINRKKEYTVNFGNLELLHFKQKIKQGKLESGNLTLTRKTRKILFIDQPFLKYLSSSNWSKFYIFLEQFCLENNDSEIIWKLHPRSDEKRYIDRLQDIDNLKFKTGDITDFIFDIDYIVSFFSTVVFLGLIADKKVVIVDPIQLFKEKIHNPLLSFRGVGYMAVPKNVLHINNFNLAGLDINNYVFDFDSFKKHLG